MTAISLSAMPINAECRTRLADGRIVTITASRRPRANRADVKCSVPNAPAIAERMQQIVRLARHTEVRLDSRDQVVLSMDIAPAANERDWELAAVLADRMVRGLHPITPGRQTIAQGSSDAWHLGRVDGVVHAAAVGATSGEQGDDVTVHITHLGALSGMRRR